MRELDNNTTMVSSVLGQAGMLLLLFVCNGSTLVRGAVPGDWLYTGNLGTIPAEIAAPITGVTSVSAGEQHSLAVKNDGTVIAWGLNYFGECDVPKGLVGVKAVWAAHHYSLALKNDGTIVTWGYATPPPDYAINVKTIAIGSGHVVALQNGGTVVAWGDNTHGQIAVPVGLADVLQIAAGGAHSLALKADGTVVAWGNNQSGQTDVPTDLSGVVKVVAIHDRSLALKSDGTVVTWGGRSPSPPTDLVGVTDIAVGVLHTLALKSDGTVISWGNSADESRIPHGLAGVTAIAAGSGFSVALRKDGTVVSWGNQPYYVTEVPAGLSGVSSIAAGDQHTVALKNNGTIVAWGDSKYNKTAVPGAIRGVTSIVGDKYYGALALKKDGRLVAIGALKIPPGLKGVKAIAEGGGNYFALKFDGTLVAWTNVYNQHAYVPDGLSGIKLIATDTDHAVALKNDGLVVAWKVRNPTLLKDPVISVPKGLSGVKKIAAGQLRTFAIKNDGSVTYWGPYANAPQGLANLKDISAGGYNIALKNDGTIVAWDSISKQILPTPTGLHGVTAVAAGNSILMALKSDGTVSVWGRYLDYNQPTGPSNLTNITAISIIKDGDVLLYRYGTAPAPIVRPDLMVGRGKTGRFTGNNKYNRSSVSQSISRKFSIDKSTTFRLRIQNDGDVPDRYTIKLPINGDGFRYKYWNGTKKLQDATLNNSPFTTGELQPGSSITLNVVVSAVRLSKEFKYKTKTTYKVVSERSPTQVDTVSVKLSAN